MGFPLSDLLVPSRKDKAKLYGTKPVYTSPETAAAEALAANLANLPKAEELGGKVNVFNQEQIMAMLRRAIPNYDAIVGKQSELIQSGLRGEVPKDVQDQLTLRTASKAISGGYAGSGVHRNLEARDFGLTSWDITNKSLDSASRWTQSMASLTQPALFNVGSAFISPQQQFDFNKLVAETKAAPNPGARGAFDSKMAALGMMLGVYGGAGYQNAYRPSGNSGAGAGFAPQYLSRTGASEGGGNVGSPFASSNEWGGKYGESGGFGAFDF